MVSNHRRPMTLRISSTDTSSTRPVILPRIRQQIIEAVSKSRVTIITGPTGCGKSTQVPALLLDSYGGAGDDGSAGGGYVLCTQPRRLAVVQVAKRVATERNASLGGKDVGYHIGQNNLSTHKTRLLFTTAGILLEELRANGMQALTRFRVILIDECHERSPESDLVLTICKSFMTAHPTAPIRLVLMSATFDHARYRAYFADVPNCEAIENITLETASSFSSMYERVGVSYIEDVIPHLPDAKEHHGKLLRTMWTNPDEDLAGDDGGKSLSQPLLRLIKSLVTWLNDNEPEDGIFLIFAPTYRHLEQCYDMLRWVGGGGGKASSSCFGLGVLHSSVDVNDCLREMKGGHAAGKRKVLLCSAIADSSVTIPNVTCVIDLCRSLEVRWDCMKRAPFVNTTWSSQSVCDQRKGRTGRTCPGRVFRLVTRRFYVLLKSYETPQLTLSSCRNETLSLLCSNNKVMNERPSGMLSRCLDAPTPAVVTDSMEFLQSVGACHIEGKGRKKKLKATLCGELLAAMPFTVSDSTVVLAGAQLGLLHEILAFKAICSHKPAPIVHYFGNSARNESTLLSFFPDVQLQDPSSVALANLSAYIYWDTHWNAERAIKKRNEFQAMSNQFTGDLRNGKGCEELWYWSDEVEEEHVDWCRHHDINPTAVRSIAEIIDSTINILFHAHYEPDWLRCSSPTPIWRQKDKWKSGRFGKDDMDMLRCVYGAAQSVYLCDALTSLSQEDGLSSLAIQRALVDIAGDTSRRPSNKAAAALIRKKQRPVACVHFLQGHCQFGSRCRNSHAPDARPPKCRFYPACTNSRCVYSHGDDRDDYDVTAAARSIAQNPLEAIAPLVVSLHNDPIDWYFEHASELLLLGEGSFHFTRALRALNLTGFSSSTFEGTPYRNDPSFLQNVDATRLHLDSRIVQRVKAHGTTAFSWCFPFITGMDEDETVHDALMLGTFHSLTALCKESPHDEFSFALMLQGDQLCRWNVLRSALRTGWELTEWNLFEPDDFVGYQPSRATGEAFPLDKARFYVFQYKRGHIL